MRQRRIWIAGFLFLLLIASSLSFAEEPTQLRILYLNDFHGFAQPCQSAGHFEKKGGIAFLAGEVNRLRAKQPALLLAAGDFIQGNPWTNLFDGKSAVEVMNAMNFSAMVLGNHEFDYGQDVLKKTRCGSRVSRPGRQCSRVFLRQAVCLEGNIRVKSSDYRSDHRGDAHHNTSEKRSGVDIPSCHPDGAESCR